MKCFVGPLVALGATLGGGCANMKPGLGFDDVRQSVAERTGMQIHWENGSVEDREARQAVDSLLAQELTVESAVQIALLNNRELHALYEDLNIAQADVVQAGLLKNPVFTGEVRWSTDGSGTAAAMDVALDFVSLLLAPLRKGRAEAAFEAAKIRVTGAVLDHAGRTRAAFINLQAAEQLLEMRRTVVEATAASFALAQRLRAAGNNRELDVFNEQALFEQSRLDLASVEAVVTARREHMNELMGLWGEQTAWRIASRLPSIPAEEVAAEDLEGRAIDVSLDLAAARRDIEVAARELGIAKPFGSISEVEVGLAADRETEGGWSVGPSLALPIPIFDQGQAAIGARQARLRQASQRYVADAVRVRSRVRAAYAATLAARDRAKYCEQALLPLRQRILDQTQLQYNAMQVGAFQLLQAKRDQIDAGAEYISSLRDYWVARSGLELILSGRPPATTQQASTSVNTSSRSTQREGGHD